MPQSDGRFESFQDGLRVGHEIGRALDLVYAAGFFIGFLWGAVSGAKAEQTHAFPKAA